MASGWKGVNETISEIKKFGKEAVEKVNSETESIAFQIEHDAKVNAPKNFGKLAQSISHEKVKESQYKVTVNESYAAYVEFGTGKKYNPHPEWSDIAAQFKGPTGKSFEDGVRSIEEWLKAKGGDPKDAKWVLLNILKNGSEAQPFLYPAFVKGRKDYERNLKSLLKRFRKKI